MNTNLQALACELSSFSVPPPPPRRKINLLRFWNGWKRAKLGFCPMCNSDAPEMYDCQICEPYELRAYPVDAATRELWWARFVALRRQSEHHGHKWWAGQAQK